MDQLTYEEALEKWARKRFPDLPQRAAELKLEGFNEPIVLDYVVDGRSERSPEVTGWGDVDTLVREIVNTALGVIE